MVSKSNTFFREVPPRRFISAVLSSLFFVFAALMILSYLSRSGYFSLVGVSIVLTNSMEPALRPGDMVLYANINFTAGDVVIYCLTPSHCIVHRVVDIISLDTVNGNKFMVVTKGDNVDIADNPVPIELVRGKALCTIPRELWIPFALVILIYVLYDIIRGMRVLGYTYAVLFLVGLVSLASVYATVPRPISLEMPRPPLLNLAGLYFDYNACTVRVAYTDGLYISHATILVNDTFVENPALYAREIVFKPSMDLLRQAFETGSPLLIRINASLNNVGLLRGEYTLLIGGEDPSISTSRGAILIRNNNCFPVALSISIRYSSDGAWIWSNRTLVVDGYSYTTVEPPPGVDSAYVYIYWSRQGDERWIGIPLK